MRSVFCTLLLLFILPVRAEGLEGMTAVRQQQNGVPEYLMHTSASYADGLLQIEIPFWGDPLVRNIGFGFTGLWFAGGIKPNNLLGHVVAVPFGSSLLIYVNVSASAYISSSAERKYNFVLFVESWGNVTDEG